MTPDNISKMQAVLTDKGILPGTLDTSGALVRCGTTDKPTSKNAAYIVHMDAPASIWWQNWQSGESGTWTAKAESTMTLAERKALHSRIEADRAARTADQQARHAEAAQRAVDIWGAAPAAGSHDYVTRKGIPALGLRLARDGRLIVPVLNETGGLQSLQFIDADGGKRFLTGGKTAEGFFSVPAKDGSKDGTLIISEGFATAASLHLATGHAVLVAFNAGNLPAVAKMARRLYPEREIILAADNDVNTEGNPGLTKATEAATTIGARLALCPAHEGKATDFNDLHLARGLDAVAAVIEKAKTPDACPMPEGYHLKTTGKGAGLYHLKADADGNESETRMGPPLLVKGMTRDADGNAWGLLLHWQDPDGKLHTWAMPLNMLSQVGGAWHGTLVDGGWLGNFSYHKLLAGFLTSVRPSRRIRCVHRVGWHDGVFVLPDATIGEASTEQVVLQSAHHARMYRQGGTIDGWRELAALAKGNSRLTFALCASFAGTLLRLAGLESGGFNFMGGSSTGKSTALHLAASVWDGPHYVRSWRTTDNAAEGLAALHNDTTLILDELGQASPKTCSEMAYMLSNGTGKARAHKDGTTRNPHSWRLLFLSSGEVGLADKLTEAGQKPKAGQEVRLVDILADAGAGLGLFETLHGMPDAGALSVHIKQQTALHFGHAGRAFITGLLKEREEIEQNIISMVSNFVDHACPQGADGQVRRVAQRFGLCAAAGFMASHMGILPFAGEQSLLAAQACFQAWLSMRGGAGAGEDAAILSAVRLFIEQHGASRFQDMDVQDGAQRCINRVGFRRKAGEATEYIVLSEAFRAEVVRGHSAKRAGDVLRNHGWLKQSDGKSTTKRDLPGMGRVRAYVLVMPEDEGAA